MKDHGLRILRGWIAALACTCLAAASHAVVDGAMPPPAILGLLLCISAVFCTWLAAGKLSLARTGLAVLLSQGAYHGAFALFGHGHSAAILLPEDGLGAAHPGHHVHLEIGSTLDAGVPEDVSAGTLMWAAHLAAAVLTVVALRRGEIAVRALAEAIVLWVPRSILFVRSRHAARGKQRLHGVVYRSPALRDVLRPAVHRRGPPRGPAFAHP